MFIRSTDTLHYPITVTKLLVEPESKVARFDTLFKYTYTSKVTEGNKYGDEEEVEKTFPAEFKSETDGNIISWHIRAGDVLTSRGYVVRIMITFEPYPLTHL
jgi:RNA polymerase II subunit A-like phosphatase